MCKGKYGTLNMKIHGMPRLPFAISI